MVTSITIPFPVGYTTGLQAHTCSHDSIRQEIQGGCSVYKLPGMRFQVPSTFTQTPQLASPSYQEHLDYTAYALSATCRLINPRPPRATLLDTNSHIVIHCSWKLNPQYVAFHQGYSHNPRTCPILHCWSSAARTWRWRHLSTPAYSRQRRGLVRLREGCPTSRPRS